MFIKRYYCDFCGNEVKNSFDLRDVIFKVYNNDNQKPLTMSLCNECYASERQRFVQHLNDTINYVKTKENSKAEISLVTY